MLRSLATAFMILSVWLAGTAGADEPFPARPITIVNPFPPGGQADLTGRPLASSLERLLKQPVVITNKSGAAGAVGMQTVAVARPDGYTVLITVPAISTIPVQAIVKWAGMAEIIRMTAYSVDLDSKAVEELEKKHGVKILKTPDDVLKAQVAAIDKVYEVETQKNPFFARVLKSQKEFAQRAVPHAQKIRPPIEVVVAHYWKK